jgi:hypothetical protein
MRRRRLPSTGTGGVPRIHPPVKDPLVMEFYSWGDFIRHASTVPDTMAGEAGRASRLNDRSFTGVKNYHEAVKLATDGWREGEAKAKAIADPIFTQVSSLIERYDVNYELEGHNIDVARFVDGEPECWQKFEPTVVDGRGTRQLKLVFNCCVSGGLDRSVIISRGAGVAALVNLLEYAGNRVEVWLAMANHKQEKGIDVYVKVKDASQNIDMSQLIYALAHPSAFRCHMFSLMEGLDRETRRHFGVYTGGGYGHVSEIPEDRRGDIYFSGAILHDPTWRSEEAISKWIIEQLEKQGVTLRKEGK